MSAQIPGTVVCILKVPKCAAIGRGELLNYPTRPHHAMTRTSFIPHRPTFPEARVLLGRYISQSKISTLGYILLRLRFLHQVSLAQLGERQTEVFGH
jgi:hypothetical protein